MSPTLVVVWFLFGIIGYWFVESLAQKRGYKRTPPCVVLTVISGPILLLCGFVVAIELAFKVKSDN